MEKLEKRFLKAEDVCELLGVSPATAYRIIKRINSDLEKQGKIVIAGKVSKNYFYERVAL